MKKTITKILMAFTLMLSLTTASNADFLVDYHSKDWSAIGVIEDSKSTQTKKNAAWVVVASTMLKSAYLKPMAFVEQEKIGDKFGESNVYAIYFKTPFWGKMHRIHVSLTPERRVKVLQNKRAYTTLWPPGHFQGN